MCWLHGRTVGWLVLCSWKLNEKSIFTLAAVDVFKCPPMLRLPLMLLLLRLLLMLLLLLLSLQRDLSLLSSSNFFPSKGNAKQFLFCSRSFPPLWPPYLLHLTMVNDFQQRQGLPDCQLPPTAGCCCLLNNLPSEEIFVLLFCLFFQRQRGQTE